MRVRTHALARLAAGVLLVVGIGAGAAMAAKSAANGIKLEGYPSAISAQQFRFTVQRFRSVKVDQGVVPPPPFQIVTTEKTKCELRHDKKVSRSEFFRVLTTSNRVEVKGYLQGSSIVAYKLEIEE